MARKLFLIALIAGLVLVLSVSNAAAQEGIPPELPTAARTWFVSTNGTGTACTQAAPCHWNNGLSNSADGDIIIVKGGLYYGNTPLLIQHPVWVVGGWTGNPSGTPIYDPANSETRITGFGPSQVARINYDPASTSNFTMFANMTLVAGEATLANSYDGNGGCVDLEHGELYLANMIIENCQAENYGGGVYVRASNPANDTYISIYNVRFNNNSATHGGGAVNIGWGNTGIIRQSSFYDNQANYGSAIDFDRCDVDIIRNIFYYHPGSSTIMLSGSNSSYDLNFQNNIMLDSAGTAIQVYGYSPVRMYHNTFNSNSDTVLSAGYSAYVGFRNNIVAFNGGNHDVLTKDDDADLVANKNIFWENAHQSLVGSNPIYQNPRLSGSQHLRFPSPAIDAGQTGLDVTSDYDGQTRDNKPDIGADEFMVKRVYLPTVRR